MIEAMFASQRDFARVRRSSKLAFWFFLVCSLSAAKAQDQFLPAPRFDFAKGPLTIAQSVNPKEPFTVAGERNAIFGQQDGSFELWAFPVKVLEHLRITAYVDDYLVPIDMNAQAATIEVSPDHTTITYSHAAIVVRQYMFAPRGNSAEGAAAITIFDIQSTRPATLTFRFDPVLVPEWPAPNFGRPSASWTRIGDGGGFLLQTASPQLSGLVAMPRTVPTILPPDQEHPAAYPLEMKLRYDPKLDKDLFFPLLAAVSYNRSTTPEETTKNLVRELIGLNAQVAQLYAKTRDYYSQFFNDKLVIESPDAGFNQAIQWAELTIDQSQVLLGAETGLVAGWVSAGAFTRPGYGWFFGRDALWSVFAIDAYGDFTLARKALEFLIRRQRADGKIMHEYSQTAGQVQWEKFPYWYAAADSTPLFVMAMADYVRASGDTAFLQTNWNSVKRAYTFTRSHGGKDGAYDNKEGTGWVEDWKPRMPDQESYLVALDEQSAEAIAFLATFMKDADLASAARAQAGAIRTLLYSYRQPNGFYAFSRNQDGSYDLAETTFPSVAWWTGSLSLPDAEAMLSQWASHEFSSDWGLRSLSEQSPWFDPLSYHQGTVWPLFTGWVAMAEYRAGHPLAGYQQLMSSVNLIWAHDPGGLTELLSGKFNEPLGRSSSRQMWSSAMVISVALRGLLGIEPGAAGQCLRVLPALPAAWDRVTLRRVPYGDDRIDLSMSRRQGELLVEVVSSGKQPPCLCPDAAPEGSCKHAGAVKHPVSIRLQPVELELMPKSPLPGSQTQQMKVLEERYSSNALSLRLEAPGKSVQEIPLRFNSARKPNLRVTGAILQGNILRIVFPPGDGYQKQAVDIRW
jgi:glycogen debranching enzyme